MTHDSDPVGLPQLTKRADETRNYTLDVGPAMQDDDTIRDVTEIAASPAGLTTTFVQHTGAVIEFQVAGGAPGGRYVLEIRWTTEAAQQLESLVRLQVDSDQPALDQPLAPWPMAKDQEAAAVLRLSRVLPGDDDEQRLRSIGSVAAALVERYAPDAPQAILDEGTIRCAGWLSSQGGRGIKSSSAGPIRVSYDGSTGALRASGAMNLLAPWRVRRAGVI